MSVLTDRACLAVGGADATHFLQNLVTCDLETLSNGSATFGGLLTPQGKILFDFLVTRQADRFVVDVRADRADDLLKRLTFYRLRAAVTLERLDEMVVVAWGERPDGFVADPRAGDVYRGRSGTGDADWQAHRIALGLPECGSDFAPETAFPHEALWDQYTGGGVDFTKGCYVGQEVVSRMQHRGTARSRFVHVSGEQPLPSVGTDIVAGDRSIGRMGSSSGKHGLALLRLDRAAKADQISADGVVLNATLPAFASFGWPETADG